MTMSPKNGWELWKCLDKLEGMIIQNRKDIHYLAKTFANIDAHLIILEQKLEDICDIETEKLKRCVDELERINKSNRFV